MSETALTVVEAIPELADVKLDKEAKARIEHLFALMSSKPEGFEEDVEWRPETIRLAHPITNDPLKPQEVMPGDIYAPGTLLWSRDKDGRNKPFKFVLCYAWQSRARFQPGDRTPDCSSSDGKWNDHGTMECRNCPDLPFRDGRPTSCNNTINMVVLPLDLSGVYVVRFSKTSYKAGSNIRKLVRTSQHVWDRVFGLTSREMSGGNHTWNVLETTAVADEVPPEVKLFAQHVSRAYAESRKNLLESLAARRKAASEGLAAMESLGDDAIDVDDGGFEDSM